MENLGELPRRFKMDRRSARGGAAAVYSISKLSIRLAQAGGKPTRRKQRDPSVHGHWPGCLYALTVSLLPTCKCSSCSGHKPYRRKSVNLACRKFCCGLLYALAEGSVGLVCLRLSHRVLLHSQLLNQVPGTYVACSTSIMAGLCLHETFWRICSPSPAAMAESRR
jgi:hypothetical protein